MSGKLQFEGFAYCPELRRHHIFLDIPTRMDEDVVFVEDVSHKETPREKARIPLRFWNELHTPVAAHFNRRIKENPELKGCPRGKFVRGQRVPVDLLLGRELLILVWAVEPWEQGKDPVILYLPRALDSWLGMTPEERWTLFRLTNSRAGHRADTGKGWRRALRYGLCGELELADAPVPRRVTKKKAPPRTKTRPTSSRTRPSRATFLTSTPEPQPLPCP